MATQPPKSVVEAAVKAAQIYCGSVGKVAFRAEQRLYERQRKAIQRVVDKSGMAFNDAHEQITTEARRRGCKLALPGKDI